MEIQGFLLTIQCKRKADRQLLQLQHVYDEACHQVLGMRLSFNFVNV